jgi:CheY-like chemotaxis protein
VVLDLMMPRMNGWEFLQACHTEGRCVEVPVLVISAYLDLPQSAPAELGLDTFLPKPFDLHDLVDAVEQLWPDPTSTPSGAH